MVRALPIITVSDHGLGVAVGGLIVSSLQLKYFFTEGHDDARIWAEDSSDCDWGLCFLW
jgi:hypothetical protein